MSNGFQNPNVFTNECLRSLQNNIVFAAHVVREYDDKFGDKGGKIGDTLNIRRPARFTVSTGAAFSPQDYTETSIPLVINNQKHVDTNFTSSDLTLKVEDFIDRVINPKLIQLAQQIDQDGCLNAKNTVGNLTGTIGTAPNNVSFLFDNGRKLDDFSVPRDERYMVIDQGTNAALVGALTGFFNPQAQIASQFKQGVFVDMQNTVGFKIGMSQNVIRHTTGPLGGAPVINGANQSLTSGWSNTANILINGWTAAAAPRLNQGDVITLPGCFTVNPVTRQSTGVLLQFVVLANVSSDAAGASTVPVSPAPISAGPFQNCTAAPTNGGGIVVIGTTGQVGVRNIGWYKDAFTLGCVDLLNLAEYGGWGARKTKDGFSLRVFRQAAIATDTVGTRVDVLYGWATPYPEQAAQMVGN